MYLNGSLLICPLVFVVDDGLISGLLTVAGGVVLINQCYLGWELKFEGGNGLGSATGFSHFEVYSTMKIK